MPLAEDAVRVGLACGPDRDGRWRGWYDIRVRAGELWTLDCTRISRPLG
ncbi:hypothetical protein ACFQZ4_01995 [Catellatospora coxensis]